MIPFIDGLGCRPTTFFTKWGALSPTIAAGGAPVRPVPRSAKETMTTALNVLFLCTGNSARSILAEAYLNTKANGRFKAYSAGSHPAGQPNPYAMELLKNNGIDTGGLRSKSWDEFAQPGAPELHFVFTVCDNAAGETCPYWPGQPITAHWGVADPAAAEGSDEDKRRAFLKAFSALSSRINLFLALPMQTLSRQALVDGVRHIGRSGA
jgi:protein-tyrosine-phosphatase